MKFIRKSLFVMVTLLIVLPVYLSLFSRTGHAFIGATCVSDPNATCGHDSCGQPGEKCSSILGPSFNTCIACAECATTSGICGVDLACGPNKSCQAGICGTCTCTNYLCGAAFNDGGCGSGQICNAGKCDGTPCSSLCTPSNNCATGGTSAGCRASEFCTSDGACIPCALTECGIKGCDVPINGSTGGCGAGKECIDSKCAPCTRECSSPSVCATATQHECAPGKKCVNYICTTSCPPPPPPPPCTPGLPGCPCPKNNPSCLGVIPVVPPAENPYGGKTINLKDLITIIYDIMVPVSVGFGLFFIILAGYKLNTSQGDPIKKKEGMEQLTAAIIGVLFVVLSLTMLNIIIKSVLGG